MRINLNEHERVLELIGAGKIVLALDRIIEFIKEKDQEELLAQALLLKSRILRLKMDLGIKIENNEHVKTRRKKGNN